MSLSATLGNELFTSPRPLCVMEAGKRGRKATLSLFFLSSTNYLVIILFFIRIPSGTEGNETAGDQKLQSFHYSVDSPVQCF